MRGIQKSIKFKSNFITIRALSKTQKRRSHCIAYVGVERPITDKSRRIDKESII